jgi:PPM family protein phosphatase
MEEAWSTRLDLGELGSVILIADGLGGHTCGELASRMVAKFLSDRSTSLGSENTCEAALHAANEYLYELMDDPQRIGMGTTVVGLAFRNDAIIHFNVGDSRLYRYSGGELKQLSTDDRSASDGNLSHGITQALSGSVFPLAILPHIGMTAPLGVGDRLMLCSDGLTDMLPDPLIKEILTASDSPALAVESLFTCAMQAGGRDNISVAIVAWCSR